MMKKGSESPLGGPPVGTIDMAALGTPKIAGMPLFRLLAKRHGREADPKVFSSMPLAVTIIQARGSTRFAMKCRATWIAATRS